MKIEPKTLKGFRDFLPDQMKKRQYVIDKLRAVFESYGFEPLETPALEYEEILTGKYGEEGDKLMYRFEDLGGRKVAMRYDQTVPLARVVSQYKNEITFPFKRYQIQPVWRADNTQRGRFREFYQCDIDIVGSSSQKADAEILTCVSSCIKILGFDKFKILVNDRQNFKDYDPKAIAIVDKLKKIGEEKVKEELKNSGFDENLLQEVIQKSKTQNLSEIVEMSVSQDQSLEEKIIYEPTLARGLDYYTGLIIEVEIEGFDAGSVGGGGRYDNLIGIFSNEAIPAVGFAFGFDRLIEAMDGLNLFPQNLTKTQILVTVFSDDLKEVSANFSTFIRNKGVNSELYLNSDAKIDKQIKYADKKGVPFVAIIGPDESSKNMVTIKNLKSRDQQTVQYDDAASAIQTKTT